MSGRYKVIEQVYKAISIILPGIRPTYAFVGLKNINLVEKSCTEKKHAICLTIMFKILKDIEIKCKKEEQYGVYLKNKG